MLAQKKEKVAIIGSGNWGSAIAKVVGRNLLNLDGFEKEVCVHACAHHPSAPPALTLIFSLAGPHVGLPGAGGRQKPHRDHQREARECQVRT